LVGLRTPGIAALILGLANPFNEKGKPMKHLSLALVAGSLLLTGSHAFAQSTAKATVTIIVPKNTPSFSDQRLVVMLTHNFPTQDDRGNRTVDKHIDTKFSHVKGKDTIVTLTLGDKVKLNGEVQYSVNVSVFDKASKCIYVGNIDDQSGPFPVVTNGAPLKLRIVVVPAS
jgi:hypothetical protein